MQYGLRASVESHLHSSMRISDLQPLLSHLMLYAFNGCHQSDIREVIRRQGFDFDFLAWRREYPRNGLLLKDQKVWAYWAFVNDEKLKVDSVSRREANALECALETPALRRHLRSLYREGAAALTLPELDGDIQDSLCSDDVNAYLRTLVRTKMSFLVQSFGYTKDHLFSELRSAALVALLKSYPRFEDIGHMRAICKSAAKNHCINFIKTNTTQSRQRLKQNEDGTYSNLMVPMESFGTEHAVASNDGTVSASLVTGLDGVSQSHWEQLFALRQLMHSDKLKPKQRLFLSLALGTPNGEFTAFLGQSNEKYMETRPYGDYLSRLCQFMQVNAEVAKKFLASLQKFL